MEFLTVQRKLRIARIATDKATTFAVLSSARPAFKKRFSFFFYFPQLHN
jgi:hypothetical protein